MSRGKKVLITIDLIKDVDNFLLDKLVIYSFFTKCFQNCTVQNTLINTNSQERR